VSDLSEDIQSTDMGERAQGGTIIPALKLTDGCGNPICVDGAGDTQRMGNSDNLVKYPRTPHVPWSPGNTADDIVLDSIRHLESLVDVVVTEKLDG